ELRLACDRLWHRLRRHQDPREHAKSRHGAADQVLAAFDRAVRHGVLYRRPVPGLAQQPVSRRARRADPGAARAEGRHGRERGAAAAHTQRAHPRRAHGARRRTLARDRQSGGADSAPCAGSVRPVPSGMTRWDYRGFMFKPFERYLQPTAVPEHPEPPAHLLAFLWHFARQAKWLFAALFLVEFFVALTDSAVPWFMGRLITLVTRVPPGRFLAETWPWLLGMALVVLLARPATA